MNLWEDRKKSVDYVCEAFQVMLRAEHACVGAESKGNGQQSFRVPDIGDTHCLSRPSWRGSAHLSPGKNLMRPMFRNKMEDRDPIGKSSNLLFQNQDPGTMHVQGGLSCYALPGFRALCAWAGGLGLREVCCLRARQPPETSPHCTQC